MIDHGYGVKLKAFDSTDVALAREWRNDPLIWKWCRQDDLISDAEQERWFQAQDRDPSIHMYVITAENRERVGVCGLTSHHACYGKAEFSLYIAPPFQRKGLAKAGLKTLMAHGFLDLNLHVIYGETFENNPAAKMFESLGMKLEGTLRHRYRKGGERLNTLSYSILEEEWTP